MVQASLNMVVAAKTNHPTTHTCRLALDFNCVSFILVLEYHIASGEGKNPLGIKTFDVISL